ncbi:hypothetical protein QJQ45_006562 [Haematococcus lacustris]|nr:hypothetical protein QJQ45_006562 [Haematococcus lacustris]
MARRWGQQAVELALAVATGVAAVVVATEAADVTTTATASVRLAIRAAGTPRAQSSATTATGWGILPVTAHHHHSRVEQEGQEALELAAAGCELMPRKLP